jgi:acyl carrier protein
LAPNEIDKVVLIESFKEEFGVEIPDDAAKTILTVGDAIKFLEKASAA